MIFYTTLTNTALAKISAALAAGTTLTMSEMAVGDGNGTTPNPTPAAAGLVNERFRAAVNQLATNQDGYLVAELVIPVDSGGYTVREIALFDDDGQLFAVGNTPSIDKPEITENSLGELVLRMVIAIDHVETINLTVDTALVTATQQWVEFNFSPAALFPGGTTGQVLAKKSNADGDTEWKDPTQVNVVVDTIEETQTLATGQTVVNFSIVTTTGLAVYIEGIRLPRSEWTANTATQITLASSYPAGSKLTAVQNEPAANLEPIKVGQIVMLGLTTEPAQLFGYGTWSRVAEGRAIFGLNVSDSDFNTLAKTGGSKTHSHTGSTASAGSHSHTATQAGDHAHTGATGQAGSHSHGGTTQNAGAHNHSGNTGGTAITIEQMPSHSHTQRGSADGGSQFGYQMDYNNTGSNPSTAISTQEAGQGQAHSHTINSEVAHNHGINTEAAHNHSIANSGTHTHDIQNNGNHSHTLTTSDGGNLPPYFTVAMWQRTA